MEQLDKGYLFTDIGTLEITGTEQGVVSVAFVDSIDTGAACRTKTVQRCITQLSQYFGGRRIRFSVPLSLQGTAFRMLVWGALTNVPFGSTASYSRLARAISRPRAAHAVGGAVAHNPIAIIIPCHRIVGADGSLTGYAGGLDRKQWLLEHEQRVLASKG